ETNAAHDAAVVGHRFDVLPVDFEENISAVDATVEGGTHRLDAGDEHAADASGQIETINRLAIQIAHVEPDERLQVDLRARRWRRPGLRSSIDGSARRPLGELHRDRLPVTLASD